MDTPWWTDDPGRLRIGLSACLLGEPVRWDGGHKRDGLLCALRGPHLEYVAFCPEVAAGLGVPRPPIRLQRVGGAVVAAGVDDPALMPDAALRAEARAAAATENLCAVVLKSRSPSCGVAGVPVFGPRGGIRGRSGGVFASTLAALLPWLPMVEEEALHIAVGREGFFTRAVASHRLLRLEREQAAPDMLAQFQRAYHLTLRSHGWGEEPVHAAAHAPPADAHALRVSLLHGLRGRPTVRRHVRVLRSLLREIAPSLEEVERARVRGAIAAYHARGTGRGRPLALLRAQYRRLDHPWAREQTYLNPSPLEISDGGG